MNTPPPLLFCDLETYSDIPITCGAHRYAEAAEILLFAWASGDHPVEVWDCTTSAPMPDLLRDALENPQVMTVWHNGGMFDTLILRQVMGIDLPLARVHDTQVQALAHGLPGSLNTLCHLLDIPTEQAKNKDGRQLIHLFCKPRAANCLLRRASRDTHPEEWQHFMDYARQDTEAIRSLFRRMPRWNLNATETALWHLDQRINRRGMCMDAVLAKAAMDAIDKEQQRLKQCTQRLTDNQIQAATQRDALLQHITDAFVITLPDMQASTLQRRIDDPNTPAALRELLAVRLQSCSTSTSKYKTLLKSLSHDGRLRGTKQFCGASRTGRWAGRLFQPDNLPRATLQQTDIESGIRALKAGCADLLFDDVMQLTSSTLRACIIAPPGKKLVVSDLSNIEGRILAWLAGEKWKLQAFRDDDAGHGHDLYKLAYAQAFHTNPDTVSKAQRQVGKVLELGLGYQGGVAAFLTFATAYQLDLNGLAQSTLPSLNLTLRNEAQRWWQTSVKRGKTFGLSQSVFMTCNALKTLWRNAHPETVSFWHQLEDCVRQAISTPGTTLACRRLALRREGAWLRILLPSGRTVCYPGARLNAHGEISYMGNDPYTRKWQRLTTYGGKLVENVTQACARDVLATSMMHIEHHGYPIILTVHDEVLTEVPDNPDHHHKALSSLLATVPGWADGLPLAASGFDAYYYRKD